jgi:hypothetical protein
MSVNLVSLRKMVKVAILLIDCQVHFCVAMGKWVIWQKKGRIASCIKHTECEIQEEKVDRGAG